MILREPEPAPTGRSSLRDALEVTGRDVERIKVNVSATGPLWYSTNVVNEIQAAVKQAVENAARHSGVSKVTVFAEEDGDVLAVTVRDSGVGFNYDERALAADGKVGIVKSMKGRIEDLGGEMRIVSAPGAGTEIEFKVPVADA